MSLSRHGLAGGRLIFDLWRDERAVEVDEKSWVDEGRNVCPCALCYTCRQSFAGLNDVILTSKSYTVGTVFASLFLSRSSEGRGGGKHFETACR